MADIVATAGWALPRDAAERFAGEGSVLQRYATRFAGVEVNSSFHRSHRPSTWARWAESVPEQFRFAVKIPKRITHERKLADCADVMKTFLEEVAPLGPKLAVLLVQLPPSLPFASGLADAFFGHLRAMSSAQVACEPRHPSWFEPACDCLLRASGVARVAADPALSPEAAEPGGWRGLDYWRLHGSPAIYRSPYGEDRVGEYARRIVEGRRKDATNWCVFDNTASGAATLDALLLTKQLAGKRG
jgi:uncharacterized protein YecE (DUF72 family)